jgi:hypothetical protein
MLRGLRIALATLGMLALGSASAQAAEYEFTVAPDPPTTGEVVTFQLEGSTEDVERVRWDLNGDGEFDDGELDDSTGFVARYTYTAPGTYAVSMRVTDEGNDREVTTRSITVNPGAAPPPPPAPPPPDTGTPVADPVVTQPDADPLVRMRPFPIVRIAGIVLPDGADVRILSVRGPRGARVRVRCRGRGCPVNSLARTTRTRLIRIRRFERKLRAGITLELFIRKPNRIGKYTRFRIRAGKPPARVDRCLVPGSARPVRCG